MGFAGEVELQARKRLQQGVQRSQNQLQLWGRSTQQVLEERLYSISLSLKVFADPCESGEVKVALVCRLVREESAKVAWSILHHWRC